MEVHIFGSIRVPPQTRAAHFPPNPSPPRPRERATIPNPTPAPRPNTYYGANLAADLVVERLQRVDQLKLLVVG